MHATDARADDAAQASRPAWRHTSSSDGRPVGHGGCLGSTGHGPADPPAQASAAAPGPVPPPRGRRRRTGRNPDGLPGRPGIALALRWVR